MTLTLGNGSLARFPCSVLILETDAPFDPDIVTGAGAGVGIGAGLEPGAEAETDAFFFPISYV